jgi:hypothetical protein
MKRRKIYISGQISGLEPEDAESTFNKMEKTLRAQGYSVVNPTRLGIEDVSGKGWDYYMKKGIKLLLDCDAIYMLQNWTKSRGARIEWKLAYDLDMTIYLESDGDLLKKKEILND